MRSKLDIWQILHKLTAITNSLRALIPCWTFLSRKLCIKNGTLQSISDLKAQ